MPTGEKLRRCSSEAVTMVSAEVTKATPSENQAT